jgi:uncharacterized protein (TIGR03790 family)
MTNFRMAPTGRALVMFWLLLWGLMGHALHAQAQGPTRASEVPSAAGTASAPSAPSGSMALDPFGAVPPQFERKWVTGLPRVLKRITAKDVGVIINTEDPYSVRVGEYYAKARGLADDQILRVSLPIKSVLSREEFADFSRKVDQFYGDRVQAVALAWRMPYGVDCNSITGALTMGFDPELCAKTCGPSRPSKYFASPSSKPYKDFQMRLSMLLAASNSNEAIELIDRGVRADGKMGLKGTPPVNVHYVTTGDGVRSVRKWFYPPEGPVPSLNLNVHLDQTNALKNAPRVMIYMTGLTTVDHLDTVDFLPGALADHLTSFGGILDKGHGQMTVLSWIGAGATASYGTTSEPCSHPQKFPHPQVLFLYYVQGVTAIEAYWRSVAWPQQGLFVGEPLAAPFSRNMSRP